MDRIICEVASPLQTWTEDKTAAWIMQLCTMLNKNQIKTINLAEVVEEERFEKRSVPFIEKMDNLHFAEILYDHLPDLTPIICKITTRLDKKEFIKWVDQFYSKGFRYLVIVGSLHHDATKQSFCVTEAARYIKEIYPEIILGGIAIFNRDDEVDRIWDKMQNGIEFFLTQIIFETHHMENVLTELHDRCLRDHISFPHIYISLAPAANLKDLEFFRWLGVEIPPGILSHLAKEGDREVETRTFDRLKQILDEIVNFMERKQLHLGFNIEPIFYSNLILAEQLMQHIKKRVGKR